MTISKIIVNRRSGKMTLTAIDLIFILLINLIANLLIFLLDLQTRG